MKSIKPAILFIADPGSIHDLKWISHFADRYELFLVRRKPHVWRNHRYLESVHDLGVIDDFSLFRPISTIKTLLKLRKIIAVNRIAILHIHFVEPNILWTLGKGFFHVKIVATTRGTDILKTIPSFFQQRKIQNTYVKWFYKKAFLNCDVITCTSKSQQDLVKEFFGKEHKIELIRTGIAIDRYVKGQDEHPDVEGKEYILMPRAMRPLYNHEMTLEAIDLLSSTVVQDYTFVFVDSDSTDHEYVTLIRERMNTIQEKKFHFLPKQDQSLLFRLYEHASLVIMNPKSDGSPVTAMEALFYEVPLILGPVAYDEELFGEWVYRMKEWNAEELSGLIIKALKESNEEMLRVGKEKVLEKGNRGIEMTKMDTVYKRLIQ